MAQVNEKLYFMAGKRVFVAGHRGMVGSALCRRLSGEVILQTPGHHQLDLAVRLRSKSGSRRIVRRPSPITRATS